MNSLFELVFVSIKTGNVNYAITEVRMIRYITRSEVGYTDQKGRLHSASFPHTERLEVNRLEI